MSGAGVAGHREDRSVVRRRPTSSRAGARRARPGWRRRSRRSTSGRRPSLTLGMHSMIGMGTLYNPAILSWRIRFAIKIRRLPTRRGANRESRSCSSRASTIISADSTSSPSACGRASSSWIAATRGRAPTSSARAARSPSGSAKGKSCSRPAPRRSSAATPTDARRLLTSAVERGARPEEALALLERLDRLAPADVVAVPATVQPRIRRYTPPADRSADSADRRRHPRGDAPARARDRARHRRAGDDRALVGRVAVEPVAGSREPARPAVQDPLPVPSASEVSLARARSWSASGHLRDALTALDAIRPGDPLRAQADELRARIQQQLLDSAARGPARRPSPK